jgi:hypothetical protein
MERVYTFDIYYRKILISMINITHIYLVENININNPYIVYIGKSTNLKVRKRDHKRTYGSQISFNEIDGVNSLDRNVWRPIETMWIQIFISWGYDVINTRKEGGSGPSFHNDEVRSKISLNRYINEYNIDINLSDKFKKVKQQWDQYKTR